ncbi:hypothetical protein [Agarivorans gilvus]|uniref:DNA repair protein n=1 Tax=Agarivorans gilvus TaxID=680279 RepID=A0ABQ1I012_9ALTE|nr:hypothetical protein [Agarivorans gilvus]GGB03466.1 hypothetical protein GCM10007414_15980 [Agarivorans gilvus]
MGWFSRAKSWASSVCSRVKDAVSSAVDKVKSACSKVWNAFTGKHYADEAEAIIAETQLRYDKAKQTYESEVRRISADIEQKVSQINQFKLNIYQQHFARFMKLSRRLHNVVVAGQPFEELFDDKILEIKTQTGVRAKSEIMLIDFNQMGLLDTLGMVLTLGIFSRKKAKESLQRAKDEQRRVNEEISKMQAQPRQLQVVAESIDNVCDYFSELVNSYSQLLDRFEYGIQTQRMQQLANNSDVFAHKLDFKLLPVAHLEEFRALFNLSIVLKQMANLGYLSESGEFIDADCQQASAMIEQVRAQQHTA